MKCPAPDRLLTNLAGENGAAARASAEAHVQTCASCRAGIEALVTPGDSLVRLIATTEPTTAGHCPELEDLACWCAGDQLQPEKAARISLHVSGCEACAFSSAQQRLELGTGSGLPYSGVSQDQGGSGTIAPAVSAASRASVVAQVVGALTLVLVSVATILPRLDRPDSTRGVPAAEDRAQRPANPADWPFQAFFEFRLEASSETHRLMFPHHPGVHLSRDYEYAVHFAARRAGWYLLFSTGPDQRLSLLVPGGGSSHRSAHLEAGETARFPSGVAWEPVAANSGRRQFYAVYLDSITAAEDLVTRWRDREGPGQSTESLVRKLDDMVVAGGCSAIAGACVLTFEYEVL